MEQITASQSLMIALWVGAVMSRWLGGGATLTLRFSPLMTGLVCGIVLGNVHQAMIVTAALQLIYMGVFSPGGSMPSEPSIAAAIAVPVALMGNLDPMTAIGVAVPVGLMGSYLYQFRFFINTFSRICSGQTIFGTSKCSIYESFDIFIIVSFCFRYSVSIICTKGLHIGKTYIFHTFL